MALHNRQVLLVEISFVLRQCYAVLNSQVGVLSTSSNTLLTKLIVTHMHNWYTNILFSENSINGNSSE